MLCAKAKAHGGISGQISTLLLLREGEIYMRRALWKNSGRLMGMASTIAIAAFVSHAAKKSDLRRSDAALHGVVRSSSGAPLAGIPVHARLQGKHVINVVYTNRDGQYGFQDVEAGS